MIEQAAFVCSAGSLHDITIGNVLAQEAKNDILGPFLWFGGFLSKVLPQTRPGSVLPYAEAAGGDVIDESGALPSSEEAIVPSEVDDGYDGIREGTTSEEVEQPVETAERSETRV